VRTNNAGDLDRTKFDISGGPGDSGGGPDGDPGTLVFIDANDNSVHLVTNFRIQDNDYTQLQGFDNWFFNVTDVILNVNTAEFNVTNWVMDNQSEVIGNSLQDYNLSIDGVIVTLNDVSVSRLEIIGTNVTLLSNGVVDGSTRGFGINKGPGKGGTASAKGGSYGGNGGGNTNRYGSALVPDNFGSGGGDAGSASGGGYFSVQASTFVNNGKINVSGETARGAAAGGGIFINVTSLSGSGTYIANGGFGRTISSNPGGGGGGGRIAVWANDAGSFDQSKFSASGGDSETGTPGEDGTIVFVDQATGIIYAGEGYRTETDDFSSGQLQGGGFVVDNVAEIRLGLDTFLNMIGPLHILNSTLDGASNSLRLRGSSLSLNNSNISVDDLDLIYNSSFSDFGTIYKSTLTSLRIERESFGSVNFTQSVTNIHNLSLYVNISSNFVSVNSSIVPGLNTTATIAMITPFSVLPEMQWDPEDDGVFTACPASVCTFISFSSGTGELVFNVSHFTGFSSGVDANLTIFDDTDPEGGSQTKETGQNVSFFANYTNSSNNPITGACNISIPIIVNNTGMTFNVSGTELYEYSTAFSQAGTFDWNVSCTNTLGLANLTASDTVLISETIADVPEFSTIALMIALGLVLGGFAVLRKKRTTD